MPDFRQIDVFPTSAELLADEPPHLQPNQLSGPYASADHYLSVHFRLMREDFIAPLRSAIRAHRAGAADPSGRVTFHQNVQFSGERPTPAERTKSYALRFETPPTPGEKRFMFGALLCFTRDNFATLQFATVAEWRRALVVDVRADQRVALHTAYVMVEYGVYFESYAHVLRRLQETDAGTLPMREYIVRGRNTPRAPDYLRGAPADGARMAEIAAGLNAAQAEAFSGALGQEFAVIQGPPGTGKTHLAVRVTEALVARNRALLGGEAPVLVVALTNRALDAFLEGALAVSDRVVRFGGQSRSARLEAFTLRAVKRRQSEAGGRVRGQRKYAAFLGHEVRRTEEVLRLIERGECVVDFWCFGQVDSRFSSSWFYRKADYMVIEWLMDDLGAKERWLKLELEELSSIENSCFTVSSDSNEISDDIQSISDIQSDSYFSEWNNNSNCESEHNFLTKSKNCQDLRLYLTLSDLKDEIVNTEFAKNCLKSTMKGSSEQEAKLCQKLEKLNTFMAIAEEQLQRGKTYKPNPSPPPDPDSNPWLLSLEARWNLYFTHLTTYKTHLLTSHPHQKSAYTLAHAKLKHLQDAHDIHIMRTAEIIGMTTTCAARLRPLLQLVRPPIVIVEEAAELLEAQLLAALTPHCRHLVQIGDHRQLRPKTADFRTDRALRLGISLFERMLRNRHACLALTVQHRMRPEFAALIAPLIYARLENHRSVAGRAPVRGVRTSLFFVDHAHRESGHDASKVNRHEVGYLLALAAHLVGGGHAPADIAILSMYAAQSAAMERERDRLGGLAGVRIAVLDGFQGEEAEIVLLSLVRNNADGRIGFLSNANRVCVALSRARCGFYIMGNLAMLMAGSWVWRGVGAVLEAGGNVGRGVGLRGRCGGCGGEAGKVAEWGEDFGGEWTCGRVCGEIMECGHYCREVCHDGRRMHDTCWCYKSIGESMAGPSLKRGRSSENDRDYFSGHRKLEFGYEKIEKSNIKNKVLNPTVKLKSVFNRLGEKVNTTPKKKRSLKRKRWDEDKVKVNINYDSNKHRSVSTINNSFESITSNPNEKPMESCLKRTFSQANHYKSEEITNKKLKLDANNNQESNSLQEMEPGEITD